MSLTGPLASPLCRALAMPLARSLAPASSLAAPSLLSATVATDGETWTLQFSKAVSQGVGWDVADLTATGSVAGALTFTYSSGDGTSAWVFTASAALEFEETATLDWAGTADGIEDMDGQDLEAIADFAAVNGVEEPPAVPLIATGSYTGDGELDTPVALDFEPDFVMVWADSEYPWWRNHTCWHGRSQRFSEFGSQYAIGPYSGEYYEPFKGDGFSVRASANVSGKTYHYLAIRDNGIGLMQSTSFIGSATAGRSIVWTDATPDAVFLKRDSDRPSIWRWAGLSDTLLGSNQGGVQTNRITAIGSTGVTVGDSVDANENNNAGRGEGIEAIGFFERSGCFELARWTGDGTSDRLIATSFEPAAVIIFDEVNDVDAATLKHGIVTAAMGANVKHFDNSALSTGLVTGLVSGGIQLDEGYNVSARGYAALVFKSSTGAQVAQSVSLTGRTKAVALDGSTSSIALANEPHLSGACALEWYGRPRGYGTTPLLMLGEGDAGTLATSAGEYNGGLFLHSTDPDGHGWAGNVLRWIQHDYYSPDRSENSINYYNLNGGLVIPEGRDLHVVVTHDGAGHWRVYVDGKRVKDFNLDLDQATYGNRSNGGAGVAAGAAIGAYLDDSAAVAGRAPMLVYSAAIWSAALSDADCKARYQAAIGAASYAGASPTKEYDFTGDGTATDATQTATTVVDRDLLEEREPMPRPLKVESGAGSTLAYTPPAAPNAMLVVCISAEDVNGDAPVTAVSFGAAAMTLAESASAVTVSGGHSGDALIYYLDAPGTSEATISVTGGERLTIVAMTLTAPGAITLEDTQEATHVEVSGTTNIVLAKSYAGDASRDCLYIAAFSSGDDEAMSLSAPTLALSTALLKDQLTGTDARQQVYAQRVGRGKSARIALTGMRLRAAMVMAGFASTL